MFWRGKRKYTGYDRDAKGRRAGTSKLIDWILFLNKGKFRNLGSWTVRDKRGKAGVPTGQRAQPAMYVAAALQRPLRNCGHEPVQQRCGLLSGD